MTAGANAGSLILRTTSAGIGTITMAMELARSRIEETPRPADCSVVSSWRFFIRSTDSPEGQVLDLVEILVRHAGGAKDARALSSVPDFGAPTEMRLPFRSASVLMPESTLATIWM